MNLLRYLFDGHTHSQWSHDGVSTLKEMAKTAIKRGLSGFCLTDHYDGNLWQSRDFFQQQAAGAKALQKVREMVGHQLNLRLGVELGEIFCDIPKTEALLEQQAYDMVLLAVHKPKQWADLVTVDFATLSQQEIEQLFIDYFSQLDKAVQWGGADVVAHLTLPTRYLKRSGRVVDLSPYNGYIDSLLQNMVKQGMGLEVNTSGLRDVSQEFMPTLEIVKKFLHFGGEIVTIGSDAHQAKDIGSHLQDGMTLLEAAGYRYFAVYENRKPKFYLID